MKAKKRRRPDGKGPYSAKSARIWWYRMQMGGVAVECFESLVGAKEWVRSPAMSLRGRVPWRVCVTRKGLKECVTAIRMIDANTAC
jgi:uncharacterized protein (DUF2384 family)